MSARNLCYQRPTKELVVTSHHSSSTDQEAPNCYIVRFVYQTLLPKSFKGLGTLGEEYTIKHDAVPYALHTARRVPIPLHKKVEHGRRKVLQVGGAQSLALPVCTSMHSMRFLGGSGGMPPRKICKNRHQEIEFGGNLASKQASMTLILLHVNFKLLNS